MKMNLIKECAQAGREKKEKEVHFLWNGKEKVDAGEKMEAI